MIIILFALSNFLDFLEATTVLSVAPTRKPTPEVGHSTQGTANNPNATLAIMKTVLLCLSVVAVLLVIALCVYIYMYKRNKRVLPTERSTTEQKVWPSDAGFGNAVTASIDDNTVKKGRSETEIYFECIAPQKYKTLLLTNDHSAAVHVTFHRNGRSLNKPDDVHCKTTPDANNRENTSALNASPLSSADVRFYRPPLSATQAQIHSDCSTGANPDDDAVDESAGTQLQVLKPRFLYTDNGLVLTIMIQHEIIASRTRYRFVFSVDRLASIAAEHSIECSNAGCQTDHGAVEIPSTTGGDCVGGMSTVPERLVTACQPSSCEDLQLQLTEHDFLLSSNTTSVSAEPPRRE